MNRLPTTKRSTILAMLLEGSSMRAITRMTGVSINTVAKLLNDVGAAANCFMDEHMRRIRGRRRVECSKTWAFKGSTSKPADSEPQDLGHVWTYTAMDADSQLILSCLVGNHSRQTTTTFIKDLRARLAEAPELSTTRLQDHHALLPGNDPDVNTGCGRPSKPAGARTRRLEKHLAMTSLYALHYNFCRVHSALGVTPAMEAGLDDMVRGMDWIVELVDARASKPNRPKTYRRRTRYSN